jgi:hypothetical protein
MELFRHSHETDQWFAKIRKKREEKRREEKRREEKGREARRKGTSANHNDLNGTASKQPHNLSTFR